MNVSEVVKTALKYPQEGFKNTVIFTAFLILFLIFSFLANFFSNSLNYIRVNGLTVNESINAVSQISYNNLFLAIVFAILSLIVCFIYYGYIYRVFEGHGELPDFNNFKSMIMDGIKVLLVGIAYNILPIIVLAIGFRFNFTISCVGFVLLIITSIFLQPMALVKMAKENSFRNAFKVMEILEKIKKITLTRYIGSVIFSFIIQLIVIIAMLIVFTIVGMISLSFKPLFILFAIIFFVVGNIVFAYLNLFSVKTYELLYEG